MDTDAKTILEQLGDPADVGRELEEFRRSARSLSNQHSELIDRYPDEWVAIFEGNLRAHGRTFQSVMDKIEQAGLPRERTLVRFIDKDGRAMIL